MSLSSGSLLTSSVGVSSSFVVDFSSPPPLSGVIRLISSHLHRVVGSVLEARRMMKEGNTCGHLEHTMLVQLATTYRSLLTAPLLGSQQPLTPAQQEEETARDLLLQLFKCLLPYAPSASAVHELLKIIEGIDHKQVGHASKTESGTSPSTAFGALIPDPSASSMSWPFALCGMLIDACSTSPSIPYVLFDGEAPSTLVITALSAAVWPPGIAPTQPTAAAAAALAQNNPSIGYTYSVWLYMESVIDAAALDACEPTDTANVPASLAAPHGPAPKLADIGKSAKSPTSANANAARFTLINLCSEDGKTGMSLVYQADTGTLILRTGTAAARSPPSSTFSFRFNPIVNPTTYEFTNVGLIPHRWCHLLLTHTRGCLAGAHQRDKHDALMHPTASLYLDGQLQSSARVSYVTRASSSSQTFKAWLGSGSTDSSATTQQHAPSLRWRWRMASSVLLGEVIPEEAIQRLFDAGPRIAGVLPCVVSDKEGVASSITPTLAGAANPGLPSSLSSTKVPLVDVVAGCYALPSACCESLDAIAALVSRQRKSGTFASVGTMAHRQGMRLFAGTPSGGAAPRMGLSSPTNLHEHLLAPALSSEQELLTQTDITPLESHSTPLNSILDQQHIIWCFHARHSADRPLASATVSFPIVPSGLHAHTVLHNTGCSSPSTCGDALLYGAECSVLQPSPPQDMLRHIGGIRRILMLVDQCAKMPSSLPGTAGRAGYSEEFNPASALRQCLLLLLMCLRRHPKNFRDMHALDGYKLLGYLLRQISRKKFRIRDKPAAQPTLSLQALGGPSSRQFSSPGVANLGDLPPLGPPDQKQSNAALSSSSHYSSLPYTLHPFLDAHLVDLIFALVGLSEKGMGGYIANLLALEHLLLDYRLWERTAPELQLYVFQGLINACVGNPDRSANIAALREARFVPWLLVILTNTKTFEPSTGWSSKPPSTSGTPAPSPRIAHGKDGPEMSLLNHILTLLRVLLMSELIDQELHLLANFSMTRTIHPAKPKGNAPSSAGSNRASASPGPTRSEDSPMPMTNASPMPGPSPTPSDLGSVTGSPLPREHGHGRTSQQQATTVTESLTALTARRIQQAFIEMLLDVLMKIVSNKDAAGAARAMQIFTKSISFHWIFGVLKGEKERMSITDSIYPAFAPPSYGSSLLPPLPTPPSSSCAILTLKILLVLLENPTRLSEFRSASVAATNPAAVPQASQAAQARMVEGLEPDADTLSRVISFASLSNLLLPYASCASIYPILLCILLGKSIHHLSSIPSELSVDTVEEIFSAFQENGNRTQLSLVVPEVVDILVDLLSRCLHILSDEQQYVFQSSPASFFSASAAVASFQPTPACQPSATNVRVYADAWETGVLQGKRPQQRKSKFGIDQSKWNSEKEDQLPRLERTHAVRTLLGLDALSQNGPVQALHDPPSMRGSRKPAALWTGTPTAALSTPGQTAVPTEVGTADPGLSSKGSSDGAFTFGSKTAQAAASSVAPSSSLLNGLILFFMRLLHSSEDFGRVVSRSTFLRPFVAAVFSSAHLNPIVSLATLPPAPIQPARPASAQSLRPPRASGGVLNAGHPPMPPSSKSNLARALAFGQSAAPPILRERAHSSIQLTGGQVSERDRHSAVDQPIIGSPQVFSPEPEPSVVLVSASPFSPSSENHPSRSMSPESENPLRSPPSSRIARDPSQLQLFSPMPSVDVPSTSPPVPVGLPRMNLVSPGGATESPSSTAMSGTFGVLASPQYIAFQQAQLGFLVAPASPPGSPSGNKRAYPSSTPFDTMQLSIDAASTPLVVQHQQIFHGQLSARSQSSPAVAGQGGGPHSLSTNTQSAFFSPSENHLASDHPGSHAAFTFTPKHRSDPQANGLGLGRASELLEARVNGAALSPDSLRSPDPPGSFLASASPSAPVASTVSASIRIPIFRHATSQLLLRFLRQIILYHLHYKKDGWLVLEKILDAFPSVIPPSPFEIRSVGGTTPEPGVENYERNEELIRGFQSAVLSIVIVRLQEKLAATNAPPGLFVSAGAGTGAAVQSAGQPSKFLSNLARISELVFLRIQSGLFQSGQWGFDLHGRVGRGGWSLQSQGSRPSSTASSAAGLMQTLVAALTHDGLRTHLEDLSNAAAAADNKSSHRRKSSNVYNPPLTPVSSSSTFAALTASPLNKALRTVQDVVMNCVLHLYDQFTLKEITVADLTNFNCFLWTHRKVIMSEYMLAAHVSEYISSANTIGGAPPTAMATTTFTSKSFVACVLYHLYNFQLNASPTPALEQVDAFGHGARTFNPSDSSSASLVPYSPSSGSKISVSDLRHSALALLIHLVRTRPSLLAELMRATVLPGGEDVSTKKGVHSAIPEHGVTYDLFTRGFDVLLSGFAGPSTGATPFSGAPSSSPTSQHRMAEVEGFFDWLAIQQPLIESVFSRTLLPEWRSYCKFLNGFLYATNSAAMARIAKVASRDASNAALDSDDLSCLHSVLTRLLSDAAAVDSGRYLRRVQALVEREQATRRAWTQVKRDVMRMYALFSDSRRLNKGMPHQGEWNNIEKHKRGASKTPSMAAAAVIASTRTAEAVSSDDEGDLLVSASHLAWRQSWKLDPLECTSRLRVRLVRATLTNPHATMFSFPYKKEADELREARRLQEAFLARQEVVRREAALARKAAASVPLIDRPEAPSMERGFTVAASSDQSQDDSPDVVYDPSATPSPRMDLSTPAHGSGMLSSAKLVVAVDPTPMQRTTRLQADVTRTNIEDTTEEDNAPEPVSVSETLLPPQFTTRRRSLSSGPAMEMAHAATAAAESAVAASAAESAVAASGEVLDVTLASFTPAVLPLEALQTGRAVPEASDRPAPPKRVPSVGITSTTGSPAVLSGSAKRKTTFFNGLTSSSNGSSRHLLPSSRHHAPGGSPRQAGSHSPNQAGDVIPTEGTTVPVVHLYPQIGMRRGVSFNAEPSPESAGCSGLDLLSPNQLTNVPSTASFAGLPSPPQLQVDTPGREHARGKNSIFSPSQDYLQPQQLKQSHETISPALSDVMESSAEPSNHLPGSSASSSKSMATSPGVSPRARSALDGGGQGTNGENDYEDSNAYYSNLLTEEYTEFLYEERLRLLLEEEQINFHYNCLRVSGLQEISAIFLLCSNSIFIVDQYQVNPDGSIVRLEASGGQGSVTADKNALISEPTLESPSSEDADTGSGFSSTSRRWSYTDIVSVHKRRYLLRPAALELFFADHSNYFLVVNIKQRELIYKNLLNLCPNITDGLGAGMGTANAAASAVAQAAQAEITSAIAGVATGGRDISSSSGGGGGGTLGREMSSRLSSSSGVESLSLPPVASEAVGLGVGVGGLTSFSPQDLPAAPAAGMNRLTSNLSSLFFTNHTLATEAGFNQMTAVVAAALDTFTTEWQHGFLSNYDYLILLNSFSGRSFNDLTQYPVFPWVLADYDSAELDLHNHSSFRDLSKPMGALDDARAAGCRQKYRETEALWREEEREAGNSLAGAGISVVPGGHGGGLGRGSLQQTAFITPGVSRAYHHGTHYSSAAIVMYYLLRLEPFSQHLISFQSGRFDRPDRLFSSIKQTYLTASKVLSGDVKELIPELFYLPSMLVNGNDLDLGHRQDGRPVSSVLLPPWAKGSAREFIRLHRLALESEIVSANLHLWIDLIFGAKQTGEAAARALNVFHYVTYAGHVDIDKITDPVLRRGMIEQTRSFGQTPAALFIKPHPPKLMQSTPGRLWCAPTTMQPTDTAVFSHPVAQILCIDRSVLLQGVSASAAQERLLISKPHHILSIPSLQPVSSFLPYSSLVNPAFVSPRSLRLSKAYRASSPMCNKASFVQYGLGDGSLRNGLMDVGSAAGGGLDSAVSVSTPASSAGGPSVRSVKSYLNLHDGTILVASFPMEGDDGTLVTGGLDGLICIWQRSSDAAGSGGTSSGVVRSEEESYALVAELVGHRAEITCLVVSKSFGIALSGSADGSVILWDLVRLHSIRTLRYTPRGSRITHVSLNLANGDIAYAASNPTAMCFTDINGLLLARYPDPRALSRPDAPYALKRDYPLDEITSLELQTGIGCKEERPSAGGAAPMRADTAALLLSGHASGVIRIWHLRWLSLEELFTTVTPSASFDQGEPRNSSAPPLLPAAGGRIDEKDLGPPLVRCFSEAEVDGSTASTGSNRLRTHSSAVSTDESTASPNVSPSSLPSSSPGGIEFDREVESISLATALPEELPESASIEASQIAARNLSSMLFGAPGEEQLSDDWIAAGAIPCASSSPPLNVAPGTTSVTAAPKRRQWHFVCVGELLGHQVSVTALSLTRNASALYSGDANGNVVHFTSQEDAFAQSPCSCKQSHSKTRLKLYHSLSTGSSSGQPMPPSRIACATRGCSFVGCEFDLLDHVRTHEAVATGGGMRAAAEQTRM